MSLSRNNQRQGFDIFQVSFFFFTMMFRGAPTPDHHPPFPTENLENAETSEGDRGTAAGQRAPASSQTPPAAHPSVVL